MKESRKQKLSMRQTLFPHLMRQNLLCLYTAILIRFSAGTIRPISMIFLTVFEYKPISRTVLNLHKNEQHFLKFALFFIKDAKNHRNRLIRSWVCFGIAFFGNVHTNSFGPPEELDEHTKLSISIFIAFYHAAVESVLLTCFSSL